MATDEGYGSQDRLLGIKEAADFLSVSVTSLRRWSDSGELPCYRVGRAGHRRFRQSDLLAYLDSKRSIVEQAEE
jgi:transcriptional repressor of dcmA and dcmR